MSGRSKWMRGAVWALICLGLMVGLVGCQEEPAETATPVSPLATTSPLEPPATSGLASELGGRVLFHRRRGGVLDIYVLDLETGEETQLTSDSGNNFDPVWSPDGTQIAFASDRNQNPPYCSLWLMNADGSNPRSLFDGGETFNLGPTWSPDGQYIAFQSNRSGNFEIHRLEVETGEVTNLTQSPNLDANPAWSPDGATIAFASDRGGNPEIWLMNADGTGARQLTDRPMVGDWRPSWSPDGQRVVFESFPTLPPRELVIQTLEGGMAATTLETPSDWNMWPAWATEGLMLFASSERFDEDTATGTPADLYLMDLETGERVQITDGSGDDGRPTWRP